MIRAPYLSKELKQAHKTVTAIHERPLFVGYSPTKEKGIALLVIVNETMQKKQILTEEIKLNKLDQDIRYTSIYDWDWKKDTATFEIMVLDKMNRVRKYIIYCGERDHNEPIWRKTIRGYKCIGLWMGDAESDDENDENEEHEEVIAELQNRYSSNQNKQGTRRVSFASDTYDPQLVTHRGKAKTKTKQQFKNQAEIDTYLEKRTDLSLKRKKRKKRKKKQMAELARLS